MNYYQMFEMDDSCLVAFFDKDKEIGSISIPEDLSQQIHEWIESGIDMTFPLECGNKVRDLRIERRILSFDFEGTYFFQQQESL